VTRTAGFWGNHANITACFLPVASCGIELDNTANCTSGGANCSGSTAEDLCQSGQDSKAANTSPQQLQLIRQCTAAALNIAASTDLGGSCEARLGQIGDQFKIDDLFATCCGVVDEGSASTCEQGLTGSQISASHCIDAIDAFNQDSNTLNGFTDFCPGTLHCADGSTLTLTAPCKAQNADCQAANGNGFVNSGRDLGPK
jgi:hypothetical protein